MRKIIGYILTLLIICVAASCSTKKNTGMTRRVQAFKAKYNTYYNGNQAFIEGYQAQRDGNKDNYMEILPFYMTGNAATQKLGSGQFDRAIEKSQKTIKLHSITKKPELSARQRRTPKGKAFLALKEYNLFLHKAWFLMGNAQFQKGEYFEAASTFAYIQRLFSTRPNIVARARVMEAKCYAEMDWYYDAENLLTRAERDSFPSNLEAAKAAVLADCQLRQQQYAEAIPNIQKAVKKQKGSLEKARLYYLLGQLYHQTGQDKLAYKAFGKVFSKNPPYELEFNARIKQTEVLSKGQSKKMISKLRRMARSDKNKEYLDQVYYAIGNIYLAQGDTVHALYAYKDGVEKSTRNGIEKGIVWLHLGQLYWDREEFVKAQECYAGVLGLYDKERDDYDEIDNRAKILEELLPYAQAVELQDSLQTLARMDSVERMKKIKLIIEEVKKKEKEEAKKNNQTAQANRQNQTAQETQQNQNNRTNRQNGGEWYFYNPTAVANGRKEFQKKWGQRELADDWQRSNKTVLADEESTDEESDEEALADSTANDSTQNLDNGLSEEDQEELAKLKEYENDPHRPEYYLKDIPFTDEQMAESNKLLVDGLYNSAIIYKDRMENFPLAERTFQRICIDFPDFEHMDETYYNMFQLYSRYGRTDDASDYKDKLLAEFPDNEHAKLLADPNFEFKARYGVEQEDSIYQDAYNAYLNENYDKTISDAEFTAEEYPEGANRARFMFLRAMSRLNKGETQQFMSAMKEIVDKYPQSTVSELAGLYVKGLQDGRLLQSGRMNNGSIWERRRGFIEGDSLMSDTTFSDEKNCNWLFVIAYESDSINENRLLFEMAQYNFSNFTVRNFDMEQEKSPDISLLKVGTFMNYDEAYIYFHRLASDKAMMTKLEGLKLFIISEDNLTKIAHGLSYAEYFDFYDEVFDRVGKLQIDENLLDEPDVEIKDPDDLYEEEQENEEYYEDEEENYIF